MVDDSLTALEEGCMQSLDYFGIFHYPLTVREVHSFNTVKASLEEVGAALRKLESQGKVFLLKDTYYALSDDDHMAIEREQGYMRAADLLKRSGRYVRIIARAPFVRGIAISGSLSKFYASPSADIDYFVITETDRLWIARTLLHLFKKLTFITGHQHFFCMNYFIDSDNLVISHVNLYSAIETMTVLPTYNAKLVQEFIRANGWTMEFLPNFERAMNNDFVITTGNERLKRAFEWALNRMAPNKVNNFLMKVTDRKWRRKWRHHGFSEAEYRKAFQTETGISKNHPADFERKVLDVMRKHRKR